MCASGMEAMDGFHSAVAVETEHDSHIIEESWLLTAHRIRRIGFPPWHPGISDRGHPRTSRTGEPSRGASTAEPLARPASAIPASSSVRARQCSAPEPGSSGKRRIGGIGSSTSRHTDGSALPSVRQGTQCSRLSCSSTMAQPPASIAMFTRMHGTCEREAPARHGKLREFPRHQPGNHSKYTHESFDA
jgi:hypothetical protein